MDTISHSPVGNEYFNMNANLLQGNAVICPAVQTISRALTSSLAILQDIPLIGVRLELLWKTSVTMTLVLAPCSKNLTKCSNCVRDHED
jgi:hypothetical protein